MLIKLEGGGPGDGMEYEVPDDTICVDIPDALPGECKFIKPTDPVEVVELIVERYLKTNKTTPEGLIIFEYYPCNKITT